MKTGAIAFASLAASVALALVSSSAPAGTPRDIVSSLHITIVNAVGAVKVTQQFAAIGSERIGNSPEEFTAHIKAEIAKWGKVLKGSSVPLQ